MRDQWGVDQAYYTRKESRYAEVAWQYRMAGIDGKLFECITDPEAFALFQQPQHQQDFLRYAHHLNAPGAQGDYETVIHKLMERLDLDPDPSASSSVLSPNDDVGREDGHPADSLQTPAMVSPRSCAKAATMYQVAQFAQNSAAYKAAETLLLSCVAINRASMLAAMSAAQEDAAGRPTSLRLGCSVVLVSGAGRWPLSAAGKTSSQPPR
eukprot:COSAG01_NODE_6784_length_3499_cov_4.194706_1_plen_210_part_00